MILCFFAAHLPVINVGIDTYAPMHYMELALPIVLLTLLGIENTRGWGAGIDHGARGGGAAPPTGWRRCRC